MATLAHRVTALASMSRIADVTVLLSCRFAWQAGLVPQKGRAVRGQSTPGACAGRVDSPHQRPCWAQTVSDRLVCRD